MLALPSIPKTDFEGQFDYAAKNIREYFDFGGDVEARCARRLSQLRLLEESGKKAPTKNRNVRRIIWDVVEEMDASYSFVSQARQTSRAFSDADIASLLELCRLKHLLPTRELFIALTRVPLVERGEWIDQMLLRRWTARELKRQIVRHYGNRSNGGRKPAAPTTLSETVEKVSQVVSQLKSLAAFLPQVQSGVSCGPEGVKFRVPRSLLPKIDTGLKLMEEAQEQLREIWAKELAA